MTGELSHLRAIDGLSLCLRTWRPADSNGKLLAILHGVGEHGGRYGNVAQHFTAMGFTVSALDQRGHGESEGRRVYMSQYEDLLLDVDLWINHLHHQLNPNQIFLLGHSLGGLLAVKYLIEKSTLVDGLILSGPALKINEDMSPILQKISGIIGRILPRLKTVRIDAALISQDDLVVQEYIDDPLVYHEGLPARFGYLILKATREIEKSMNRLNCPLLVMHGGADKLVYPEASWSLFSKCGSDDKTIRVFDGLYHEILNEPAKDMVLETIIQWMRERYGSLKPS